MNTPLKWSIWTVGVWIKCLSLIHISFDFDLLPFAVYLFLLLASPEVCAGVLWLALFYVLHRHDDELVLGRVRKLEVCEAADYGSSVEGVRDLEFIALHTGLFALFDGAEVVGVVDYLDRYCRRYLYRIFFSDVSYSCLLYTSRCV